MRDARGDLHDVRKAHVEIAADDALHDRRPVGERDDLRVDAVLAEDAALVTVVRLAERVDGVGADAHDRQCGLRERRVGVCEQRAADEREHRRAAHHGAMNSAVVTVRFSSP